MAAQGLGFNAQMFKSHRSVRRSLLSLGYGIREGAETIPTDTLRQFQKDFNKCSKRFGRWEAIEVTGNLDIDTLKALERAIQWAKNVESSDGTPSARAWRSLCSDHGLSCSTKSGRAYSETESITEENGTNFVEVTPTGVGKLRNTRTDHALRCNILAFERYGNVVIAVVKIPPQADLPKGRSEPIRCPCVFAR